MKEEKNPAITTVDPQEIAKFSAMADEWWNPQGKFKPLHRLNPVRIAYIRDTILSHFHKEKTAEQPLSGINLLDIGCGGGLLTEPMTRLGADATGIDASEKNIRIASLHAEQQGITPHYFHTSAEELAAAGKQFDVVLAMEIIEHVADVPAFINACATLVKPGGLMFLATLNRTVKSFTFAIVGAEYILRWLPRGTHDWHKFLTPSEVEAELRHHGLTLKELQGVTYNPLKDSWKLSDDLRINYMLHAVKAD